MNIVYWLFDVTHSYPIEETRDEPQETYRFRDLPLKRRDYELRARKAVSYVEYETDAED
jgi:hypothetical protein